jgi:hypothetical protein
MNSKYKIKSERSNDKYIIGGVAMALILVGLISIWISTANSPISSVVTATSTKATSTEQLTASSTSVIPIDITPKAGDSKNVLLAKCLAQKKITMYGAEWCAHCKDQKNAFGGAWQYVPYVECPQNTQLCLAKKVEGYPSWIKPDGTIREGFIELAELAKWAGCKF